MDECRQESLVRDMNSMVLVLHPLVASWLLSMSAGAKMEDGVHSESYTPDLNKPALYRLHGCEKHTRSQQCRVLHIVGALQQTILL